MAALRAEPGRADVAPYVAFGPTGLIILLFAGALIGGALGTQTDAGVLFTPEVTKGFIRLANGLWPPAISADFLFRTMGLMWQTLQISLASTALALVLAVPLGLASTRLRGEEQSWTALGPRLWLGKWTIYYIARFITNISRAVPELIWALVFIAMVGLGPFAGVLALAVHSAGVLGKLYAEILESVDQRIVEAVRSTGAHESQVTAWARVPVTLPVLLSYTLFRWECNMRAATVVGFVGAGGIGTAITISYKLFRYDELATFVIAILVLITLVDVASQVIRARILDSSSRVSCSSILDRMKGVSRRAGFLSRADH